VISLDAAPASDGGWRGCPKLWERASSWGGLARLSIAAARLALALGVGDGVASL